MIVAIRVDLLDCQVNLPSRKKGRSAASSGQPTVYQSLHSINELATRSNMVRASFATCFIS
jgi:hypothetical protein